MRLLKSNCFSCHNEEKKKGGLVMTSREALLKGGEDGEALVSGEPEKSALIDVLGADADPHMPPKKQFSAADIETLRGWIKDGAPWDAAALKSQPSTPRTVALHPLPLGYHPCLAMALTPDGSRLAAGCGSEVILFDATSKEPKILARGTAHPDTVQSLAWSPDGKHLVSGAFRRAVVWNPESLQPEHEISDGLTDRVTAVRFLPDGKQIVIADGRASEEGTLRIADIETAMITASWPAHGDMLYDLAVSPDGKMLATAGGDKLIKLWNLETHEETARLEGHVAQVLAIGFDANGEQLVTGGADLQLKVWDVKSKERTNSLGTHTSAINSAMWISAGPAVLAVTDAGDLIRYTDIKPGSGAQSGESSQERRFESADDALCCLAATNNGEHIFAGSHDGRIFVWNKDGKITARINPSELRVTAAIQP